MSIVTDTLNEINTNESIKSLVDEINMLLPQKNDCKIYPLQMKCAIEGLKKFDGNLPRPNHLVIQGKTQGGKTGALTSMIMLIAKFKLEYAMSIKDIYYITGDNSCKLLKQTEDRIGECFKSEGIHCSFHCMKNSNLKSDTTKKSKSPLTNAMIFIDESHYGTSSENNIVIQWLKSKGLDMHNSGELVKKRVYIISNSATTYGETNSDIKGLKSYVKLETDDWDGEKGYVGFKEYYGNSCFVPVKNGIKKTNIEDYCIEFSNRLKDIESSTGKKKCAIVRMSKDVYNKSRDIIEQYFHIETFFATGENIQYDSINWKMEHECDVYNKPIMFIIAGAYRMGVTIPPVCKKNIGVVFDFANGNAKTSVITTEQGLLGRVTGYCNCDDWRDMTIYINEKHYNGLKGCYIEHATSTPMADTRERFVANENGLKLGIIPESDFITIPCSEKFNDNDNYNTKVQEYLEGENGFKKIGQKIDGFIRIPGRRNNKNNKTHFSEPTFSNSETGTLKILSDFNNVNKVCYTTLYESDEDVIKVKYGKIVKGDYVKMYDESKKIISTMTTD